MTPERERLIDMIVRWEEARAQGEPLAAEEMCRECPELLSDFQRQVERLAQVQWLNSPITPDATPGDAPGSSVDVDLPRLIGDRYRLDALVGRGGFGRVYRGFDTWLERRVAVKIPRVDRPVTGGDVDLCRIEARKVARLRHPSIVPVHDVGRDGGNCFIVGEWIEGETLAARIASHRPSTAESVRIVAAIADALEHAHRAGFVHRDVKPANILIGANDDAYLTDFGIAVVEEDLLRDVNTAGTLPYMAPEQLSDGLGAVDHRADVYALSVVLYEALTGRRPFRAASPIALRAQIVEAAPPSPRSTEPNLPIALETICLHGLAKRPDDRYPSAAALAADLRSFAGS